MDGGGLPLLPVRQRQRTTSHSMNGGGSAFRMMLQSRGDGRYGYIIGRPDMEEWAEPSSETFATMAEADEAGRRAMKIAATRT